MTIQIITKHFNKTMCKTTLLFHQTQIAVVIRTNFIINYWKEVFNELTPLKYRNFKVVSLENRETLKLWILLDKV